MEKTTMWHLHNGILLGYKKEECFTLWDSMDETGKHVKWNKPVRERQIPYGFTHVESNEQTELTSKIESHLYIESRMTGKGKWW